MFYLKPTICVLLIITFYGLISCSDEDSDNKQLASVENNENIQLNKTLEELVNNVTSSRSARTLLPHHRKPAFTLRRRPIKIRTRAEHFPLRTQIRRVHNSLANGPQQQNIRFGYESLKSSKYVPTSKGSNSIFQNTGKGSPYRPQLLGGHKNSIHLPSLSQQYIHNFKASPAFNGQVVIHPVTQKTQKLQATTAQQDITYPNYVKPQQKPASVAVTAQQQHKQYTDFKQHPIPDQEKMQQYNEQHEKYLQQQKYLTPKNPIAYYQIQNTQHEQQPAQQQQHNYSVLQPQQYFLQTQQQQPLIPIHESAQTNSNNNNAAFPILATKPKNTYFVYEENDMTELENNNYQTAPYQGLDKEAQEYLRFMNTNEYFLPKKDPNYKQIDEETDKHQYSILKTQAQQRLHSLQQSQAPTAYQQAPVVAPQQTAYQQPQPQQHVYSSSPLSQTTQYSNSYYSDLPNFSNYNPALQVSPLLYKHGPSAAASSTILRTSYNKAYNQHNLIVNSQDNKLSKYEVPTTSTPSSNLASTKTSNVYSQVRHYSASNLTPEPLRFEFTERDALIGGFYTNAPQSQLNYNALSSNNVTPVMANVGKSTVSSLRPKNFFTSTIRTQNYMNRKGEKDDPEDGDDIQEAENNLYGRQPVGASGDSNLPSSTTVAPPSEQQDTEEYCERICAIVEDENEEIVCGSDGYMYTSEAQMECYASCLHIDVTIQGKGSCSTR